MRKLNTSFDYISKDYKGYKNEMIERLKVLMPEYTDLSETDAGIVILELAAVGLDILSAYLDSQANESLLVSAELWSSVLKWAKLLSYEPRFATASTIEQVFKLRKALDKDFVIPKGTLIKTSDKTNESAIYFETLESLTIPSGKLGNETEEVTEEEAAQGVVGKYLYTVKALQGQTVSGESIGTSNGAKDQEFKLRGTPVIYDSIEIWCDDIKWTKAKNNSFANSKKDDTHYTISMSDTGEAVIVFGDNLFGKIPPKNKDIIAYYRIGGGTEGNVAANTVTDLVESNSNIESTFNPYAPLTEGTDTESLKSIKLSAPALSRTNWGALTLADFSDFILANFPEIKLAKAIRGDTAKTCGITNDTTCDDVVIGLVQSTSGKEFEAIDTELSKKITAEFNTRKLAGMNNIKYVAVTPVEQKGVTVTVNILADYVEMADEVIANVKEAIKHYFDIGNIAIDETIIVSDIEKYVADNVLGVNLIRITKMMNYSGTATTDLIISQATNKALKLFIANDNFTCTVTKLTV